jgi:DNA-binding XRE family transcriptional regulator
MERGEHMREWLKTLRENRKFTQTDMGKKLGMSQNTYSRLELGQYQPKLNLPTAEKLSKIFKISLKKISEFEGKK